eukprot:NODE_563_length_5987_cov_2.002717.p4 type:complete len:167 gc:universal NODE_563_length_5987_cov_2.002717:2935-3435(+)
MLIYIALVLAVSTLKKRSSKVAGNQIRNLKKRVTPTPVPDYVHVIYPSEIKNYQVEQCHVPSVFPTPLCQKTYNAELLGKNVIPQQQTLSPYSGQATFCVFKADKWIKVKKGKTIEWVKETIFSKITYKVDIPDIKNVIEIRLHISEDGKRGLPVANLIPPKVYTN